MHAPNTLNYFEFSRGKTGNKVVFRACAAILFVDFEKGANINKAIKLKIFHVSCTRRHATRKECTSVVYNFIDFYPYVIKFRHHNFQNVTC